MKTLPLSEAKARLSKLVHDVEARHEQVTITRNGRPAAVLMSPNEVEGWLATIEIMKDPQFMEDIRRGIRELEEGKVLTEREIEKLFDLKPGEAAPVIGPGQRSTISGDRRRRDLPRPRATRRIRKGRS